MPSQKSQKPKPKIVEVYADGGCICNVCSPVGVTWAFIHVDENGRIARRCNGLILTAPWYDRWLQTNGNKQIEYDFNTYKSGAVKGLEPGMVATNNLSELFAASMALVLVEEYWQGKFFTDSAITIGRMWRGHALNGIPQDVRELMWSAMRISNHIKPVLLDGHPSRDQLESGIGKRGNPVSIFNKLCDQDCTRLAKEFKEKYMTAEDIAYATSFKAPKDTAALVGANS